jgi:hypothetical protein
MEFDGVQILKDVVVVVGEMWSQMEALGIEGGRKFRLSCLQQLVLSRETQPYRPFYTPRLKTRGNTTAMLYITRV